MRVATRPVAKFNQTTKLVHISIKVHSTQAAWGNIDFTAPPDQGGDAYVTKLILKELLDAYHERHTILDAIHRLHLLGHDPAPIPYTNAVGLDICRQAGVMPTKDPFSIIP